jgi:hypothetical protein
VGGTLPYVRDSSGTQYVLRGDWQNRAVEMATIVPMLALSHQTGVTLAVCDDITFLHGKDT